MIPYTVRYNVENVAKKYTRPFKHKFLHEIIAFLHQYRNNDSKEENFDIWNNVIFAAILYLSILVWSSDFMNIVFMNVVIFVFT